MNRFLIALVVAALAASCLGQGASKRTKAPVKKASVKKAPASKRRKSLNPTRIAPSAKLPHRLPKHGAD